MEDIIVPVVFFLCIAATILVPVWLRHQRQMAMIQHGLDPRADVPPGKSTLEGALTTMAIGLALTIGLSFIGLGPWLLGGLIPLFVGLARLLAVLMQDKPQSANLGEGKDNG